MRFRGSADPKREKGVRDMRTVNVGVIGFGTIGSGVVEALIKKRGFLKVKTGIDLKLKKVCDKDTTSKRGISISRGLLTKDVNSILEDPEIDIVVELIGGINPAKKIIKRALENGKDVVTANKALLCEEGKGLFDYALRQGRSIRFEASVGGGIPIVQALRESLISNDVQAIYGIVNGTSNYILRSMEVDRFEFKRALFNAKKKGFAERNATLDINGTDSAHKLALLTLLGFGKLVSLRNIFVEGISKIQPFDIEYAKDLGYSIKLLAIAKRFKDELELRVHPTLIIQDHPLARLRGVNNIIYVKGDLVGESLFYGKGAGRYPTTSAVISDIIDLAGYLGRGLEPPCDKTGFDSGVKGIRPIDKIRSHYYIRFQAIDKPGVLATIAHVLAEYEISIASVKQVERKSEKAVPIVMLTHEASEKSMAEALKKIDRLSCIKPKSVAIRIERL